MVFVQTSVGYPITSWLVIGNCKYQCKANGGCRTKKLVPWLGQWKKSGNCKLNGQCRRLWPNECMHCKDALIPPAGSPCPAPVPTSWVPVPTSCYSNWVIGSGPCPPYEYENGHISQVPVDFVSDLQEYEYCQSFPYDFVC
eukprot:GFUD01072886.1.p1 GENE.GFUD01072886.1~~GFUD01072886.1.p1  ORF type:complete len:156 (+),score=8.97 GFUD01072886.1:46-468(+)